MVNWMGRHGVAVDLVDLVDHDAVRQAIRGETRVIYLETPVNPDLTVIDIGALRGIADEVNKDRSPSERIHIVVDNTFATPVCQRPLTLGADVVCTSLTKGIGGFGTDIGGAVIGPRWLHDPLILYRKDFGGSLSPKAAWNFYVYGLPSLAARMANYQKTAHKVARFLEEHPKVDCVRYPGLSSFPQLEMAKKQMKDEGGHFAPGSMVYFVLKDPNGNGDAGTRMVNFIAENSYCITLAVSLGQVKTLIECPYDMTHAAMPEDAKRERGLVPGGIRLSVGLEDWHDIIADLSAALEQV
jgi:cystathionine beta-lyase/cystathionine gamma-synthase